MGYTIWKEELGAVGVQEISIPQGSEILCLREQHGHPCIWFRCDPSADKEKKTVTIVGTGHNAPSPEEAKYLGTFFIEGGILVFHVFEREQP